MIRELVALSGSKTKDRELNNIGKSNRKDLAFGRHAFGYGGGFRPNAKPLQNDRFYFVLVPK
jgi:hypothetical protein